MRIALVHDYFVQDGGAERVLAELSRLFPDAPVFTLLADQASLPPNFHPRRLAVSPLQRLLPSRPWYPLLTPFMPYATERLDLSGFDLAIISSSSFAKGIIAPPGTRTLCYLHTPTRFLWEERQTYAKDRGWPRFAHLPLQVAFHRLRRWDYLAAQRPQRLLTNGRTSQARIRRYYQRDADIVHPPIDLAAIPLERTEPGRFWLTGGRLVGYKRFDLCVQAADALRVPLKVFGTGPDEARLKRLAGKTVEFLGRVDEMTKRALYRDALAFLHPHVEDLGMTILEAQAFGTPVLALGRGGALETVVPGVTGAFLPTSTPAALVEAMRAFDPAAYDPARVRAAVEPFDVAHFREKILAYAHAD